MKQLLYHQSLSLSLPFFFFFFAVLSFLFGTFWDLQTNVRRAHFTVEVDFYFTLTHLLDAVIEILGYLVEPPVSSSLVPAECLHHLRDGL